MRKLRMYCVGEIWEVSYNNIKHKTFMVVWIIYEKKQSST